MLLRAWLTLRVHADAFRSDPLAYLQAVGWRLRGLKVRSRNRIAPLAGGSPHAYALWIAKHEPSSLNRVRQEGLSPAPIVPVIDCRFGGDILATLESLANAEGDTRPILIGGPPGSAHRLIDRPDQLPAILPVEGAWLCPLVAGDQLAPGAIEAYAAAAAISGSKIVYADDDLIDDEGLRYAPHFKPDWNPDLFDHHDFVSGASIVFVAHDRLPSLHNDPWAKEVVLAALEDGSSPVHLPLMLHHRRSRPMPSVPAEALEPLQDAPAVTAIIPTRNQAALLRNCVEGLINADYPKVELLVVDNGSDDADALGYLSQLEERGHKLLRRPGPFNYSALNNEAVTHASGSMLCLLNNDVEMTDRSWLGALVRQALRPEIGAVGPMLLYPDRTIQHAGVYLGIGGGAGHAHRFQAENESGYFERARLPQIVSAVTAACMVVSRHKFLAVGGFDQEMFPVAFNDVDLCLKLNSRGWQSFYEPRARLVHHESKSRGLDSEKSNRTRFAGELTALKAKWHTDRNCDPFHNPHLSRFSEQFVVAI
jgi:O-antigen biosynthesis protein